MPSNWQSQGADERPPVFVLLLIGILAVLTSLILSLIFSPKIFHHPLLSFMLITVLALLTTFFTATVYGESLSRPILGAFLVISQLLSLMGWMLLEGLPLTLLRDPMKLATTCYNWFIAALTAGLIPLGFTETLCRLSRSPHRKPIGIKKSGNNAFEDAFQETLGNLFLPVDEEKGWDYSFWEQEWNRWRLIIVTLFLIVLSIAIIGFHIRREPLRLLLLELLVIGMFSICMFLLTHGYRLYKRAVWIGESLDTSQFKSRDWLRWTGYLLLIVFLVSLILPAGYGLNLHGGSSTFVQRPQDIVSFRERHHQYNYGLMDVVLGNALGGTMLAFFLIALLALLIFPLVLFGGVFFNFDRRKLRVFAQMWKNFLAFWRNFRKEMAHLGQGIFRRDGWSLQDSASIDETGRKKRVMSWGKGPRAIVRRGYYRLVSEGLEHGMAIQKHQTSSEIGESLKHTFLDQDDPIDNITDIYQEARYGPLPPNSESVKTFERLRKMIQENRSNSRPENS